MMASDNISFLFLVQKMIKASYGKAVFSFFSLSSCSHVLEEIILRLFQVFFSVNKIMIENIAIDLKKLKRVTALYFLFPHPTSINKDLC